MRTSGLFRLHSTVVKAAADEAIHLVFFGDVHRDSPNHAHDAWQKFLKYAAGLKHALFMGLGDYVDSGSTSERACLSTCADTLHESTLKDLQDLATAKVKLLASELAFMKGRLIGLCNGNHYFSFSDGTNTDQKLCTELGCQYLGVSCFVRLRLEVFKYHRASLDIWAHHGSGAGRLPGGSINRVDQMREHADADIYVMGDDHRRMVVPATPRLSLININTGGVFLKSRQAWLVRSGSFLTTYRDGESNYNVDAGRGPCSLGHVELQITPHRLRTNGADRIELEIHGYS